MTRSQLGKWTGPWQDDYLEWICGFANVRCGVQEIGRGDQGKIADVKDIPRLLEGILVDLNVKSEDGTDYLQIAVGLYLVGGAHRRGCLPACVTPTCSPFVPHKADDPLRSHPLALGFQVRVNARSAVGPAACLPAPAHLDAELGAASTRRCLNSRFSQHSFPRGAP